MPQNKVGATKNQERKTQNHVDDVLSAPELGRPSFE